MGICGEYDILDFQNSCIRESWSAILPATFVSFLYLAYFLIPRTAGPVLKKLCWPFKQFLVLHEAEALELGPEIGFNGEIQEGKPLEVPDFVPLWRTAVLSFVSILECFAWFSSGAYRTYNEETIIWRDSFPFLIVFSSWVYAAIRPISHPIATAPYDLFTLYMIFLATSLLQIGGFIFDYGAFDIPLPPKIVLGAQVGNLIAISVLLSKIVRMPMAIPSNKVDRDELVSCFSSPHTMFYIPFRDEQFQRKTTRHYGVGSLFPG